jgi:hypothetical protein
MADAEVEYLLKLREAIAARLKQNRLQKAMMGIRTPPEVGVEIQTQELEIAQLDQQLLLTHVSSEIQAATGPEAALGVVRLQVKQVGERVTAAIEWTQKEFSREREETRSTLQWQSEQIVEAQSVARATRLEARETRDELRETLQEIRKESRMWRDQQEEKHDTGAKFYRDTLKAHRDLLRFLTGIAVLALGVGIGVAIYLAVSL